MNDNYILKVKNLTCVFKESDDKEFKAIDDFSFNFEKNKIHFIIGNSGSGKSTLVSHFNGLIKSKKGTIEVGDFLISENKKKVKNTKKLRRIISMVFQFPEYQLFKSTIEKDISFGPETLGIPKIKSKEINNENFKKTFFEKHLFDLCNFYNIRNNYDNFDELISKENLKTKIKIYDKKDFGK